MKRLALLLLVSVPGVLPLPAQERPSDTLLTVPTRNVARWPFTPL